MSETKDCRFCNRRGLPLLPLRFAHVPAGLSNLPAGMSANPRLVTPGEAGYHVLRVITEGFVYTYDTRPGVSWRCFAATPDGRFREVFVADEERPAEAPAFRCSMSGHGVAASIISVDDALQGSEVWVGYSRTWWTKATRRLMRTDGALRSQLMTQINPRALITGSAVAAADGLRISRDGAELRNHVAEYSDASAAARTYAYTWAAATDRSQEAEAQALRMHAMSPGNAIMLALGDPVGIVQDISKQRNFKAGELAKFQTERKNLREQVVADIVVGLQQQLTDAGQAKEWPRFEKHVDMGRVRSVKNTYEQKVAAFEREILKPARDWKRWLSAGSAIFWNVWKTYDGEERSVGDDLERDFARCIEGTGATKPEQEVLDTVLGAELQSKYKALWLALAGGDKKVLDFLADKGDKGADMFKQAREGRADFAQWLHKRRGEAAVRTATQETGVIGNVITSQASRLFTTAPQQAQVLGMRLRVIAASRMDVVIAPYELRISAHALVAMMYETMWGPPTAKLSAQVMQARQLRIVQTLDGVLIGGKASVEQVVKLDMWLPQSVIDDLAAQGRLPAPAAGAAAARTPLALPASAANPFKAFLTWARGADARLVSIGAALQMWNLSNALGNLRTANLTGNAEAVREAWFGITSGVLGLGGVTAEVAANTVKARIVPAVAATTSTKLLTVVGWTTLTGGLLAMGAAWAEGVQAAMKSMGLFRSGDKDAGTSYAVASWMFVVSGAAGAGVAILNAGAAFSAAGVTAASGGVAGATVGLSSAGTVLLGIPVWGWIIIGVAALIAGLWFLFKGSEEEDTPLEIWLSHSFLRNEGRYASTDRAMFANAGIEMQEFQQAVFGLHVTLEWKDRLGKDRINVEVTMPGYGKTSDYAFALEVSNGGQRRTVIDRKTSRMSSDPDLQPRAQQLFFSAPTPGQRMIPMDEVMELTERIELRSESGAGVLAGAVHINEDYYNRVKLKFEYWPDIVNRPELMMTPVAGGINFTEVRD